MPTMCIKKYHIYKVLHEKTQKEFFIISRLPLQEFNAKYWNLWILDEIPYRKEMS